MEKISAISDEERRILAGDSIHKENYTAGYDFVVSSDKLLGGIEDISLRTHTRYTVFPLHRHNYLEMMIVLGGSITHLIGDEKITLGEGDILIMNKHVSHSILKADTPDIGVNIILSDSFVESLSASIIGTVISELVTETARNEGAGIYLAFSTKGQVQITNLVENLLFELTEHPATDARILRYTVTLLFEYLSKKSGDLLSVASRLPDREAVRRATILAYLKDEYTNATLGELAKRMFLSVPYLSKLISQYFKKSFKELLLDERLSRAHELILDTDIPIGDIIQSVGYENKSYFGKEFKLRYGVTPFVMRSRRGKAEKEEE